jgi:hypothetical protein
LTQPGAKKGRAILVAGTIEPAQRRGEMLDGVLIHRGMSVGNSGNIGLENVTFGTGVSTAAHDDRARARPRPLASRSPKR